MSLLLIPLILSFAISFACFTVFSKLAASNRHVILEETVFSKLSTTLGGISIFSGFLLAILLFIFDIKNAALNFILIAVALQFSVGILVDLYGLSRIKKNIAQILIASILVLGAELKITTLQGILGIEAIPELASIVLSIAAIVGITKLTYFGHMEEKVFFGIINIMTLSFFTIFFLSNTAIIEAMIGGVTIAALIALLFNRVKPIGMGLGHSGILVVGIINAILAIKFVGVSDQSANIMNSRFSIGIILSVFMIPILNAVFATGIFKYALKSKKEAFINLIKDKSQISEKYCSVCIGCMVVLFILLTFFLDKMFQPTFVVFFQMIAGMTLINLLIQLPSKNFVGAQDKQEASSDSVSFEKDAAA